MSGDSDASVQNHGEDVDPGEPIAELAGFEHDVSVGLLNRIRYSIGRRAVTAQITTFALEMPFLIFKEFWLLVMALFGSESTRKDTTK